MRRYSGTLTYFLVFRPKIRTQVTRQGTTKVSGADISKFDNFREFPENFREISITDLHCWKNRIWDIMSQI